MTARRHRAALVVAVLLTGACSGRDARDPTARRDDTTSSVAPSTTAAPDPLGGEDVPSVVAAGDIACGVNERGNGSADVCQHGATAALVERLDPDAIVVPGDLQYPRGSYEDFVAAYDKTWGRFRDRTYPVPGNHEYATRGAGGYFRYWGDRAGPPGKGWYAFSVGRWKVIALNSNCTAVGCGRGSEQEVWLRQELATAPECTLVFWHHPRFSSGLHGSNSDLEPLWVAVAEGGGDVVIGGHDHHYERFAPERGVRSFVVGTGGKSRYPVVTAQPGSEVRTDANYGVLELRLGAGAYEWRFHAAGGAPFSDVGRDRCR